MHQLGHVLLGVAAALYGDLQGILAALALTAMGMLSFFQLPKEQPLSIGRYSFHHAANMPSGT